MSVESAITAKLKNGDPVSALAELFNLYADRVYHLALGLLGDSFLAEDVVQDTFLAVMKGRDQFEYRSSLATWIYRIAYNASIDRLRKRIDSELPSEDPGDDDESILLLPQEFIEWRWTPEQLLTDQELRFELEKVIDELSAKLKAVFILRDIEDLSIEATAQVLGISVSVVKVRLHRARLELRERLAAYLAAVNGDFHDDL
jgi:RNA polymerase sigma-70 factor, ECF subfamily